MAKGCWKVSVIILFVFLALVTVLLLWVSKVGKMNEPEVTQASIEFDSINIISVSTRVLGNNWIHSSNPGCFELYVEGTPYERGIAHGRLAEELVRYQEEVFTKQIEKLVPGSLYRKLLKSFVGWFNRDLDDYVEEEFRQEIFGISKYASDKFEEIGTPYERLMQYHAAHDLGHALQNLALVGCSSFATWTQDTASTLLVGRNFDFYVGDDFAKNKIILFQKPDKGLPFMSVTWGGMIGVVSGMNIKGITVTLNAAKSGIPAEATTPISLVAREILQYASTLDEAVEIASKKKIFVSESILVSSATDNRAIVIDMTPDSMAVFTPHGSYLVATNHFQSQGLKNIKENIEQIRESASMYRYKRMLEIIDTSGTNTPEKTVAVLRNYLGKGNMDIGLGNEKAVNQFICHHGIVFAPGERKVWVSMNPWNMGQFNCYDLNEIFSLDPQQGDFTVVDSHSIIAADEFLHTENYDRLNLFKKLKNEVLEDNSVSPEEIIQLNPEFYQSWVLAGEVLFNQESWEKAIEYYRTALKKEIATLSEREYIEMQIQKCIDRL